jgi:hypothetical protein
VTPDQQGTSQYPQAVLRHGWIVSWTKKLPGPLKCAGWVFDCETCGERGIATNHLCAYMRVSFNGVCEGMRSAVLPVSHLVQRNEGRRTCVACRGLLR